MCRTTPSGSVVPCIDWVPGSLIRPCVIVQSNTGMFNSAATVLTRLAALSSSTVSMAMTGWKERMRVLRSWTADPVVIADSWERGLAAVARFSGEARDAVAYVADDGL